MAFGKGASCLIISVFTLVRVVCNHLCPVGWLGWNQSCYTATPTPMLWTDAKTLCHSYGARMAVPSSGEENQFMTTFLSKLGNSTCIWIDCTDGADEGMWVCSEDEVTGMGYRNWNPQGAQPNDYPNNDGNGADFGLLQPGGFWADYYDSFLCHSMCKMAPTCTSPMQCQAVNAGAC